MNKIKIDLRDLHWVSKYLWATFRQPLLLTMLGTLFIGKVYGNEFTDIRQILPLADGLRATVYGLGECCTCGDYGDPKPCVAGLVTASGMEFVPEAPTAAIYAPRKLRIRPFWVRIRVEDGPCKWILVNDKGNERFLGLRGFDLSPGAVRKLTGKTPTKTWGGRVELCSLD